MLNIVIRFWLISTNNSFKFYIYIVYLSTKEKSVKTVWSKDLVHEKTFRLITLFVY